MCGCFHICRDIITVTSKGPWYGTRFPPPKRRGTLRGAQYRNTVRKVGKYQNPESKIDEILILHL